MIPRRFYTLSVFCAVALLTLFFFLNRNDVAVAVPANGWRDAFEQTWRNTMENAPGAHMSDDEEEDGIAERPKFEQELDGEESMSASASAGTSTSIVADAATNTVLGFPRPTPFPPEEPPLPAEVRVAIVDSSGTNEETTAALAYAFGSQNDTQLSFYLRQQRYGIGDIINGFNLSQPVATNKSSEEFEKDIGMHAAPHIVISANCESDMIELSNPFTELLEGKKTYLICMVHQPEKWAEQEFIDKLRPWIDHQLIDLVTLSDHTARHLRVAVVNKWDFNATVTVRHLAPLFPVQLPEIEFPASQPGAKAGSNAVQYPIAIHGDHDADRHNYTDAFAHVVALKSRAEKITIQTQNYTRVEQRAISLHILGERVPPDVPKKAKSIVSVERGSSLQRQFEILSQSYIMLPAFKSGSESEYLSKRTSWSIPAALIAGIPLASDEDILQAYSYVPRDAVWFRYAGENEMKVAERVVLWSEEEHRRKRDVVRKKCRALIRRNVELVDEWIDLALRKAERSRWRMGQGSMELAV